MNTADMKAFAAWQRTPWADTEAKLNALLDLADELTDLAKTRAGAHAVRTNFETLKQALRKLHDLALDAKPGHLQHEKD